MIIQRADPKLMHLLVSLLITLHEHFLGIVGVQGVKKLPAKFESRLHTLLTKFQESSAFSKIRDFFHFASSLLDLLQDLSSDEDWTLDGSAIFHLVYESGGMREDQVPHCTPSLRRKLMLLAFKSVRHTINLDALPSKWRRLRNQDIPNLQDEFQRVIPPQMQPLCRHWPAFLHQADPQDGQVKSAVMDMIPALCHWVAAMGIMGVVDDVCSGLYELERWLGSDKTARVETSTIRALCYFVFQSKEGIKESSLSILGSSDSFTDVT